MRIVRPGELGDLEEVALIQRQSPAAAQWPLADYLRQDFRVAVEDGQIAGFLVARRVAQDEQELLNIAVKPEFRRRGVATTLVEALLADTTGTVYLEVRASNSAAQALYKSLNFQVLTTRRNFYENPTESAIVMKFHSC
jgi:[ribosomal protein S18]-alanine N-acetyltransferase